LASTRPNFTTANQGWRKSFLAFKFTTVDHFLHIQFLLSIFKLLHTLASPVASSGFAAAQSVAAVATIELPRRGWDNLISLLLENVTKYDSNTLKESTLQAIGFICETIVGIFSGSFDDADIP
jgi:importin subunit beta-1